MFIRNKPSSLATLLAASLLVAACGGSGSPTNRAPAVSIDFPDPALPRTERSAISITAVALDPDNDTLKFVWTQTAGPAVDIEGGASATMRFTAPDVDADATLEFEIAVDDGHGHVVRTRQSVLIVDAVGVAFTSRSQVSNAVEVFFNRAAASETGPVKLHADITGATGTVHVREFTKLPGGRVAYRMNKNGDGVYRAYVAATDGSSEVDVTGTLVPGGSVEQLIVSPDGGHIALLGDLETDDVRELFVVPVSSPDGQDRRRISGAITATDGNPANGGIDGDVGGDADPQWSAQSTHLAFVGDLTEIDVQQLYVAAIAEGGVRHTLSDTLTVDTCSPLNCFIEGIYWSPDGSLVAFSGMLRSSARELFASASNGSNQRSLSHPDGPPITADDRIVYDFGSRNDIAWSPAGSHIAYTKETDGVPGLYLSTSGAIPPRLLNAGGESPYPFTWSTDGATLAFIGAHPTPGNSLYLLDVTSPTAEARHVGLASTNAFVSGPDSSGLVWSPDGSRVAYIEEDAVEHRHTLLILPADSVDGSDHLAIALPNGLSGRMPAWSPDGARLAFAGRIIIEEEEEEEEEETPAHPFELYVVDAAGENLRKISGPVAAPNSDDVGPFGVSGFQWSPKGSQIAFTADIEEVVPPGADETESLSLYVVPTSSTDGSDRIRVSHAPVDSTGDGFPDNAVEDFIWFDSEELGD